MAQKKIWFVKDEESPIIGVVPDEWLSPERRLVENSRIIVALHHSPARVGHCVAFPKKRHCPRIQDCDPDDLVRCLFSMKEAAQQIEVWA
jgi:diadenosine tetraphosphate (Ap4A) HIT family hydrolase